MLALIVGFLGMMGSSQADTVITPVDTVKSSVDSSRVLTVNRVIIIGNKVTKERIISREITLKPGDTITLKRLPHELLWDKRKIYNLRLFHTVMVRALELSDNRIDLLVDVSERWYTFPIPIFELSDRNFSEWWHNYNHDPSRINYGLNLTRYNFRGRYETLQLVAQFGFTQRYDLAYRIPYIDKKQKQGLTFNLDYSEPKNLAYFTNNHVLQYLHSTDSKPLKITAGGAVSYQYRKSFFETHSFQLGYRDTQINYKIDSANNNYFGQHRLRLQYGFASYTFNSEHRDVVQYPLRGYLINGYITKTGLGLGSNVNLLEIGLGYARHFALTRNLFLSNYTGAYWATPTSQPYALYSGMGYKKHYVRGFEPYVVETPSLALNKTTLKTRIFHRVWTLESMPIEQLQYFPISIYLKTFTDWGYAVNYPYYDNYVDPSTDLPKAINTRFTDKLIGGYGFGLDFVVVYDIVIRTEYTFTNQNRAGFFLSLRKEF
jgi:outer membrane protein assembly factor BamA